MLKEQPHSRLLCVWRQEATRPRTKEEMEAIGAQEGYGRLFSTFSTMEEVRWCGERGMRRRQRCSEAGSCSGQWDAVNGMLFNSLPGCRAPCHLFCPSHFHGHRSLSSPSLPRRRACALATP